MQPLNFTCWGWCGGWLDWGCGGWAWCPGVGAVCPVGIGGWGCWGGCWEWTWDGAWGGGGWALLPLVEFIRLIWKWHNSEPHQNYWSHQYISTGPRRLACPPINWVIISITINTCNQFLWVIIIHNILSIEFANWACIYSYISCFTSQPVKNGQWKISFP